MDSSSARAVDQHTSEQRPGVPLIESQYLTCLKDEELVIRDEDARRLRVRLLFLEEENDTLSDRLAVEDDRVYALEAARLDLEGRLQQVETDAQQFQTELRAKGREVDTLKTELASMNGLSKDSNKLLSEKLELARELATIKPELEHLRGQATFQQKNIAEKLTLQRQLATIEVELEAAKSAVSRQDATKDSKTKRNAEMEQQLLELRNELSREKQEREAIQVAAERDAREWESKRAVLEGKVEAMRTKLRSTKDELKEVQASLAQTIAQAAKAAAPVEAPDVQNKSRKRVALTLLDNTIGTPDGIAVRGKRGGPKRGKGDHTSLGEKSMFSITPYLNKTTILQHETPKEDIEPVHDVDDGQQEQIGGAQEQAPGDVVELQMDASPSLSRTKQDVKPGKKPAHKKAKVASKKEDAVAPSIKTHEKTRLDQVPEELDGKEAGVEPEPAAMPTGKTKPIMTIPALTAEAPEPKKKKRKILGTSKTIFDEEDAEATRRPPKVLLAPNRPLGRLGGKKNLSAAPAAQFAAFSPLKKDKRGVQASFLG